MQQTESCLAIVSERNQHVVRCYECAHTVMVKPREFAERHGLDMLTPMLTISRRMRCTRCEARRAALGRRRTIRGRLSRLDLLGAFQLGGQYRNVVSQLLLKALHCDQPAFVACNSRLSGRRSAWV